MCGICGIVDFAANDGRISAELMRAMADTLAHRGPDGDGTFADGPVGLGHRRLSILDLSDAGRQPMRTADGRYTLIYNGETYNYIELRAELEQDGATFRGRSDTEVVLAAFARWGKAAIGRLDGMFALAVWDEVEQRLTLARDRFGIKPLYVQLLPAGAVFGSEIKAIRVAGRWRGETSWQGLHEYLYYGNALGATTLYDDVMRLLPAHVMEIDAAGARTTPYWSIESLPAGETQDEAAVAGVRTRLERAVQTHLRSDVPVGVFLSGGVDSSGLTALAARQYPGRLQTYSVGFDFDGGVNELPKARQVAARCGTEHHELQLQAGNVADLLERLVACHDEPFGDAANIPLYLLARELAGTVKVVLQGDGGDEIFAGYRRYAVMARARAWSVAGRLGGRLVRTVGGGLRGQRAARFLLAMGADDPAVRLAWLMTQEPADRSPLRLFSAAARAELDRTDPFRRYRELDARFRQLDPAQRALYTDALVLLPDTFLEKVDKSTMAHSIEVRVPLLDNNLTSYAMALPSRLKVRAGEKKWVLRQALRGIVDDAILDGPKTGFGVPYKQWLRGPLRDYLESVVLDPQVRSWGLLDETAVRQCIDEHATGRWDNGYLLYKLLNLVLWRQRQTAANGEAARAISATEATH